MLPSESAGAESARLLVLTTTPAEGRTGPLSSCLIGKLGKAFLDHLVLLVLSLYRSNILWAADLFFLGGGRGGGGRGL